MRVFLRSGAVLTTAALVLAGCVTVRSEAGYRPEETAPSASLSPSPSVAAGPQCLDGLSVTVGEGSAAMGLRVVGITLRNCGTTEVSVEGYPEVTLLDEDGLVTDVTVLHGTEEIVALDRFTGPPKRVRLAPGADVAAALAWRNLTTDGATIVKGEYVRITPGPGLAAHTLALSVDPGNTGRLAVTAWTDLP